jgi:hypothetical protein
LGIQIQKGFDVLAATGTGEMTGIATRYCAPYLGAQGRGVLSTIHKNSTLEGSARKERRENSVTQRLVRVYNSDTSLPETEKRITLPNDVLRQVANEKRSVDARQVIAEYFSRVEADTSAVSLTPELCMDIFATCLAAGNYALVASIYASTLNRGGSFSSSDDSLASVEWPKATVSLSANLVKLLCRSLDTKGAIEILKILRSRGESLTVQSAEDLQFGYVVECADGSGRPLALMQPHEGSKIVSDSYSKYEYEIFSGSVVKAESESLVASLSWLKLLGGKLGKSSTTSAMHVMTLESPSGQQRTFKFGTQLAMAPAKVGDRVSIVCAPEQGRSSRQDIRYSGLLSPSPPGKRPGEPLSITNHTISNESTVLNRPSELDNANGPINSWMLTSFIVLASADAASSLLDPSLPFLIAAVVGSSVATAVLGANVLLPSLKRLPDSALGIQETRQSLLQEHVRLTTNIQEVINETSEDIRMLARLWQLLNKMNSIDNKSAYATRIERVVEAKDAVEERLTGRVGILSEYTRVCAMVEVEVEMETEIPLAEYQDLKNQIARMSEVESLQEEWKERAAAADEVERLLRSYE